MLWLAGSVAVVQLSVVLVTVVAGHVPLVGYVPRTPGPGPYQSVPVRTLRDRSPQTPCSAICGPSS